jgi:hypothetical protein
MTFTRMMLMAIFMIITVFMLIAGCTGQKIREGIYQGVYDSSRVENRREMTPAEYANKPDPDYNQYSKERKERIDKDIQ